MKRIILVLLIASASLSASAQSWSAFNAFGVQRKIASLDTSFRILPSGVNQQPLEIQSRWKTQQSLDGKANLNGGNSFNGQQTFNNDVTLNQSQLIVGGNINDPKITIANGVDATWTTIPATSANRVNYNSSGNILSYNFDKPIFVNGNPILSDYVTLNTAQTITAKKTFQTPNATSGNALSPIEVRGGNGANSNSSGTAQGGNAGKIGITGGNGGTANGTGTNIAGNGADIEFLGGDGGAANGGATNIGGNGGKVIFQAGSALGNGIAGDAEIKAGNSNDGNGGYVRLVAGIGSGGAIDAATAGAVVLNVSGSETIRGNTLIGIVPASDDRTNRLQVGGSVKATGLITGQSLAMTNLVTDGAPITDFITTNGADGVLRRSSTSLVKDKLGLPATGGYDLQSVMDRGNIWQSQSAYGVMDLRGSNTVGGNAIRFRGMAVPYAEIAGEYFENNIGALYLRTFNNGVISNRVTVEGVNGNVGIGTTGPTEKLHVVGKAIVTGAPTNPNDVVRLQDLGTYAASLVTTNMTATPLSKAMLNSTYPTAPVRFEVVCPNIGFSYKKYMDTGEWYSTAITILP